MSLLGSVLLRQLGTKGGGLGSLKESASRLVQQLAPQSSPSLNQSASAVASSMFAAGSTSALATAARAWQPASSMSLMQRTMLAAASQQQYASVESPGRAMAFDTSHLEKGMAVPGALAAEGSATGGALTGAGEEDDDEEGVLEPYKPSKRRKRGRIKEQEQQDDHAQQADLVSGSRHAEEGKQVMFYPLKRSVAGA